MGAAIWVHGDLRLASAAATVLNDASKLLHMRQQADKCRRPTAAHDVVVKIFQQYSI
jgi:hypothetical protein